MASAVARLVIQRIVGAVPIISRARCSLFRYGRPANSPSGVRGSEMAEQMIEANGARLCAEVFGDPAHPPILLIMGIGASMVWWEEGFCQLLADGGRFVIRYDHRDTGRSVTYERRHPGYSGADLVADAAGVLDAFAIPSAHLVGVSAGGVRAVARARPPGSRLLAGPHQYLPGAAG